MNLNNAGSRVAYCGVMVAAAMILSYVESLIPVPIPIPGIKLGLANLVTIVTFCSVGKGEAWLISLLRICLSALLFGNLYSWIFSMAGGICSLLFMTLAVSWNRFSVTGVSIVGGVMHNIGQTVAAACLLNAAMIMGYIPVLIAAGIVCGAVIGLLGHIIIGRIGTHILTGGRHKNE